jgi:hypothetical protein
MPILISQLIVKPILLTMAILNILLLGLCAYLLFSPSARALPPAGISATTHIQSASVTQEETRPLTASSSSSDSPSASNTIPEVTHTACNAPLPGATIAAPSSSRRVNFSMASEIAASTDQAAVGLETRYAYNQAPAVTAAGVTNTAGMALTSVQASPSADAPKAPLAFTTSSDGATPSQAAALARLQNDFVSDLGRQDQNPADPAYARAWQDAQASSDARFEQQFGTEAFIQAQLSQVHGTN